MRFDSEEHVREIERRVAAYWQAAAAQSPREELGSRQARPDWVISTNTDHPEPCYQRSHRYRAV